MSLNWRVVPITRWPGVQTQDRKEHRFRIIDKVRRTNRHGVNWSQTMDLLERELLHLDASDILLQMAVSKREIRKDGWVRADARPLHPGVILTFESRFGPLSYPCDTYTDWQANLRAIAVSLEALREVDRHGVSRRGEQYQGWGQLPPPGGTTATMTAEMAAEVLHDATGVGGKADARSILRFSTSFLSAYRVAARKTHPDTGGDPGHFQLVQEARRILQRHHGIQG